MMRELIPQKRVAAELGVSRSSLWRASRSDINGFPAPIVIGDRVYWRQGDLPALKAALGKFPGRRAFEEQRRHAKARASRAEAARVEEATQAFCDAAPTRSFRGRRRRRSGWR